MRPVQVWSAVAAVVALLVASPSPATAAGTLAAATAATDPLAPLLAVVSLIAWALAGWLLLVAVSASLARVPGAAGRASDRLASRLAPAGLRRLVELSLGRTVAIGAVAVEPVSAGTHLPPAPPVAAASLDWPTPPTPAAAALDWNPPGVTATPPAPPARPVVVQPGDSLWAIAADHLPTGTSDAQIAQTWPRWWTANREAVGPDPDLIHPGLALVPPAQP
jgi:hypothetical protein